jgi:LCP family protein required for cell wall assembly
MPSRQAAGRYDLEVSGTQRQQRPPDRGRGGSDQSRAARGRSASPARSRRVAGTAGYSLACVLAAVCLLVSGYAWYVVRDVGDIGTSHAITSGPSIGAQNILLMGLESRRDWNGNVLPNSILSKLHAGSRRGVLYEGVGGNDTNTLILIHIPAGGGKAIAFSIPRDDWVNFAGTVGPQQVGKIDQAYGVSMFYEQGILRQKNPGISNDQLAFEGNEAGRKATVATVEQLTGVHIDHFAEVNLDGFYELAKVLGGVNVCLKRAVSDSYSGAHFRAGYQHLDAEEALAFVRQRHGLVNGDLDRTKRQQAFIDSVIHQLRAEGVLSDISKIAALLNVAKTYVITDAGWNLLDFATQMRSLTNGNIIFRTLPIVGYGQMGSPLQDVNIVNPAYIKKIVHAAFYPPPAAAKYKRHHRSARPAGPPAIVDVFNSGQTQGLAASVLAAFVKAGYRAGTVGNTPYQTTTTVRYGAGQADHARAIAAAFGVTATADPSVKAGHVRILLAAAATVPVVSAPSQPSAKPVVIPTTGPQGGVVRAVDGVPCVS